MVLQCFSLHILTFIRLCCMLWPQPIGWVTWVPCKLTLLFVSPRWQKWGKSRPKPVLFSKEHKVLKNIGYDLDSFSNCLLSSYSHWWQRGETASAFPNMNTWNSCLFAPLRAWLERPCLRNSVLLGNMSVSLRPIGGQDVPTQLSVHA